jgi:tellurite resistance protein TehA-like permease
MHQENGTVTVLDRLFRAIPPASGAVVMGTGIVSVDLLFGGHKSLSLVPLVVATIVWVALGFLLAGRFLFDRARFEHEASLPAALTGVAGTAVLGTRVTLLGWLWAGTALLVIACILWLALVVRVLRHWVTPTVGASFVLVVSTESLAVLAAALGVAIREPWLIVTALIPLALGVIFYAFVVSRFDVRQLLVGRGDHWVAGGALAISALACAKITQASQTLSVLGPAHGALRAATLAVWAAAMCWLPVLVVGELVCRRTSYDTRRWSTVFPVGMYAACSFATGTATAVTPISDFASLWTWIGVAVWLVVLAAMLWQFVPLVRGEQPPASRSERA